MEEIHPNPLFDEAAERAVLGACLVAEEAPLLVADLLQPTHFYLEPHKLVYEAILAIFRKGDSPDLVLVSSWLRLKNKIDKAGGETFIADLAVQSPEWRNIRSHARIVIEYHKRRLLRDLGHRAVHGVEADEYNVIYEDIVKGLTDLHYDETATIAPVSQLAQKVRDEIELTRAGAIPPGLSTGIGSLDAYLTGLFPQELVVCAARPSTGKTLCLLYIAHHAAQAGKRVLFFSLEMSALSLAYRLMALETGYAYDDLRRGANDEAINEAMDRHLESVQTLPIYIDDQGGLSIHDLRTRIARAHRAMPVGLVCVDYVQLLTCPHEKSREQEVAKVVRGLKGVAKEFNIPVLAAAQLNRASETRSTKEPILADLRESGELEQAADKVVLLHSEFRSGNVEAAQDHLKMIVAKNRNGRCGHTTVSLLGANGRIYEI